MTANSKSIFEKFNAIKTEIEVERVVEQEQTSKKVTSNLAVRRDVLNKNILRIMSRYYKSLLSTFCPAYKKSFRDAGSLSELLSNFIR